MVIISCQKESKINPYFAEIYPIILEEIDINCVEGQSSNVISAQINEVEFCQYEDYVGDFSLKAVSKFSTSSPSNESSLHGRQGLILTLGDNSIHMNEHFVIHFPDFEIGIDVIDYLDSILSVATYNVLGAEDIVIPEGASDDEIKFIESGNGYLTGFLVEINSKDLVTETGGSIFTISSVFGEQENNYLQFTEAEKIIEPNGVYYSMVIDFQCNLYHWSQYGYEGLWGEVNDGEIRVNVKLEGI